MKNSFIGIDIGGTWIKGTAVSELFYNKSIKEEDFTSLFRFFNENTKKIPSPLQANAVIDDFLIPLHKLIKKLVPDADSIAGIGISTAGVVNYAGSAIEIASDHLQILKDSSWIKQLETTYKCNVLLINDADAACAGLCELGKLNGGNTVGFLVTGTGVGFTLWRNGRRWRSGGVLPLLGSIRTPVGSFDEIASISRLSALHPQNNMREIFADPVYKNDLENYLKNLGDVISTAAILYNVDEIYLSGGIVQAAEAADFDLTTHIQKELNNIPELPRQVKMKTVEHGNDLQMIGALSLIMGETIARNSKLQPKYDLIQTEVPYESVMLQEKTSQQLVELLWKAEQEAGVAMEKNLQQLASICDKVATTIDSGGRLIYVGAGSSGRIASMDAVEIPCTYGLPKDKVITLIAGGLADAAMEIESNFEEDASSVPEMLFLKISPKDLVVGISASGSSYFVQSGLAYAKCKGAYTVLMQESNVTSSLPFCDEVFPLSSGHEVVAGSTRMKAGTATKKLLNFVSTTAMILLKKVHGPYMVDVACINDKLVHRAKRILSILYDIPDQEGERLLNANNLNLRKTIMSIAGTQKK